MSDNEDLLGDDLGDQSLADYNLGNEEEEQLLADDYENGAPHNVPISIGPGFREIDNMVPQPQEYQANEYGNQQPVPYQPVRDTECVVPNITPEVPKAPIRSLPLYAPYEPPPFEEHAVSPAIPAGHMDSPPIVPSEIVTPISNGSHVDMGEAGHRERFTSERPPGVQRMPQVRDIPDSLDKVVIPRVGWASGAMCNNRGRTSWRSPSFQARFGQPHPYRRNNMHLVNYSPRVSFPPLQIRPNTSQMRLENRPAVRPDTRLDTRPETRPEIRPDVRPDMPSDNRPESRPEQPPELTRPEIESELNHQPQMGADISPERPILPQDMPVFRPAMERTPFYSRYHFRANTDERPQYRPRPNFDPRFYRPNFPPGQFAPPMRDLPPGAPGSGLDKMDMPRESEVRMLPVSLPPNLPPGGLAGKKVLINPHFKGTFQPPIEGLPAYIPTRIQKSPPPNATIENKFGLGTDIDDAAERFIAEQRNALARAAVRHQTRRSPPRQIYIDNTTIEIENDFPHGPYRRGDDDDLLRRQEEFINANRAGLRRRMRTPSPARRSQSPRRSPMAERERHERRPRAEDSRQQEDSEYQRKVREQESLRERVLRAKEVRRRKNAVAALQKQQDKEQENSDASPKTESKPATPTETTDKPTSTDADIKPDTTRTSLEKDKAKPEIVRDRSPVKGASQANSTIENLTPPHRAPVKAESPERALTPPLPGRRDNKRSYSDDDVDLILDDIDGILSDEDDSGRFKEKAKKSEPTKSKPQVDLRSKLPPKNSSHDSKKSQRQKIVYSEDREERKKREKSESRRQVVTNSTKSNDTENVADSKKAKTKTKLGSITIKSRQRIAYNKEAEKESGEKKSSFTNRRVILQRKAATPVKDKDKSVFSRIDKADPSKPNPGIFSRAVRTAISNENARLVLDKDKDKDKDEPQIQFESDSDVDEDTLLEDTGNNATVANLPPGMTDTRLKTLAGNDVQSIILDKEERSAKITFKSTTAAETFKKKFNNKMVAASRLSVSLY